MFHGWRLVFVFAFAFASVPLSESGTFVSNLTPRCLRCLAYASTAELVDLNRGCDDQACGVFGIRHEYWLDAGSPTLPSDNVTTLYAWERCTGWYQCAVQTVTQYMEKYAWDCNDDGVTDCKDYLMMNHNGRFNCPKTIPKTGWSGEYLGRYKVCDTLNL